MTTEKIPKVSTKKLNLMNAKDIININTVNLIIKLTFFIK